MIRPVRAKTRRTCRSLSWLRPGGEDGSSVGSATLAAMTQDMPSHDVYVVLTGQFLPSGYGGVSPFVAVRAPRGAPAFIGFVGDVFGARETLSAHTLDADDLVIHAGGARPGSRTRGTTCWWLFEYGSARTPVSWTGTSPNAYAATRGTWVARSLSPIN